MSAPTPSSRSAFTAVLDWGFRRYVRRFINQNFNAVRVAGREHLLTLPEGPIVCFINHPGWWDPMTGVLITDQLFPGKRFFAPIDAEALRQYPILNRLGFYPVSHGSAASAKQFLQHSRQLLQSPDTMLWLTPTGKFSDVRRSDPFMKGLSGLVDRDYTGTLLNMAIEYTFWDERYPELLVEFAPPIDCGVLPVDREQRTRFLEASLASTQAALAQRAIAREGAAFSTLFMGHAGIGGMYDAWRRLAAWVRGQPFHARHRATENATSVAAQES